MKFFLILATLLTVFTTGCYSTYELQGFRRWNYFPEGSYVGYYGYDYDRHERRGDEHHERRDDERGRHDEHREHTGGRRSSR